MLSAMTTAAVSGSSASFNKGLVGRVNSDPVRGSVPEHNVACTSQRCTEGPSV